MIHNIFSIYDAKAAAYLPPFILPKVQMAQRVFGDCVNAKDHQFSQHPEDYTLFHIGLFDDESAQITLPPTPTSLGVGHEYVNRAESGNQIDFIGDENANESAEIREIKKPHIQPGTEGGNSEE